MRIDRVTVIGMAVVAVAAATLSFTSLMYLAEACGYVRGLAWLLPISIDAYAVTATRVWLRGGDSERTRRYARRNAVGAIALSVAGNATFHSLSAAGVTSLAGRGAGQVLVIAVSAAPPVMLGLVGHLHALLSSETRASSAEAGGPAAAGSAGLGTLEPVVTEPLAPASVAPPASPPAETAPTADPLATSRDVSRPARREGTKSDQLRALVAAAVKPGDERSVAELAREFAPRVGANESHARKVIGQFLRDRAASVDGTPFDLVEVERIEEHENTNQDSNVVQLAVMAGREGQQS